MAGKMQMMGLAVATAALALAGAAVLAGCSGAATPVADTGITVTASAEVKVVPDKARISVSVTTEGSDAQSCQEANAAGVNAVIDALEQMGVAETDIQTGSSDLWPRYGSSPVAVDDSAAAEDGGAIADGLAVVDATLIAGYEMTTSLSISNLEIDTVGEVVRACVAAGANGTDGIEYYAGDYDDAYSQALQEAYEAAHAKASVIAESSGAALGKVVRVDEGYQDMSMRYAAASDSLYDQEDAGAAKVMPGQIGISATLTVTYAIS